MNYKIRIYCGLLIKTHRWNLIYQKYFKIDLGTIIYTLEVPQSRSCQSEKDKSVRENIINFENNDLRKQNGLGLLQSYVQKIERKSLRKTNYQKIEQ